jgi:hypothetical protein
MEGLLSMPRPYAAGELNHGPLALVDKHMPVVAVAPNDALFDKLKSNLQEVRAHAAVLPPIVHTMPLYSPTMPPCSAATTSTRRGIWQSLLPSSNLLARAAMADFLPENIDIAIHSTSAA